MESKGKAANQRSTKSPRNSCFPSCFGAGTGVSIHTKEKNNSRWRESKLNFFFRWRKLRGKTVPVESASSEKTAAADRGLLAGEEATGRRRNRGGAPVEEASVLADQQKGETRTSRKSKFGSSKAQWTWGTRGSIAAVESRKSPPINSLDDASPVADSRGHKPEASIILTRTSSQVAKPRRSLAAICSFPPPGHREPTPITIISQISHQEVDARPAKRFRPMVGMSILIVTLGILLLWGRFCAVVCTSAWIYIVPRLIPAGKCDELAGDHLQPRVGGQVERNRTKSTPVSPPRAVSINCTER